MFSATGLIGLCRHLDTLSVSKLYGGPSFEYSCNLTFSTSIQTRARRIIHCQCKPYYE